MSRGGVGWRWRVAALGLAGLVAACSTATPATQPPASGNAAAPSPDLGAALKPGPLDAGLVQLVRQSIPADAQAAGPAGTALATADRAEVNAGVVVDPSIPELEAALDATVATGAQQLQAKLAAAAPPPSSAPSAVPSPAGMALLAAFRSNGRTAPPGQTGAMLADLLTWVILFGGAGIHAYDPKRDSYVYTDELTTPVPDQAGVTGEVTFTISIQNDSRVVNFALQVDEHAQKVDAAGTVVGSIVGTSSFAFTMNPCPDAAGKIAGRIDAADAETDYSSTIAQSLNIGERYTASTDYTAQIDDQANVASIQFSGTAERATKGGTAKAGTGDFTPVETDLGMTFSDTVGGTGTQSPGDYNVTTATGAVTEADGKALGSMIGTLLFGSGSALVGLAGDIFRHGICFEIRVDPDGGNVGPGSQTPMHVTIYHWVDKADAKLPVQATLDGTKAIDPAGQSETAPATVTFTAGATGSTGTVTLKSVSKRGIAEHTSTFTVVAKLKVVITGTLLESTGGLVTYHLKVASDGVFLSVNPDGSLAFDGVATVKGPVTLNGVPCSGSIDEKVGVVGMGRLQGPEDAQVFHVDRFGPASLTNLGSTITCPVIGSIHTSAGDFFGQWSTALGPVDLPATGGTVSAHGSTSGLLTRQSTGTFVATPG